MIYQVDNILQDVRICLDENNVSAALISSGDIDTLSLNDIIRSKIVEAVDSVHKVAPYYLLEGGHDIIDAQSGGLVGSNYGIAIHWGDLESGWILLPSDFLRLVVFEMSDWERAVYEVISTADIDYAKQRSRFKGLRGTVQKPVCVLAMRPEGKVLEFYSCKSENATVSRAQYIPYAEIDNNGGVDISERCYKAVVYTIAGLSLLSCGEAQKAALFTETSKTFLQ